jgi:hypothetical protein
MPTEERIMAELDKGSSKFKVGDFAAWKARYEREQDNPRQLFEQISHIAVYMSYDLVDKLRWWEKETLKLSDEEIEKRIPHMASFLDRLKTAYLKFSDIDF